MSLGKLATRNAFWIIHYAAALLTSLWLGWHLLARLDFAYPVAYRVLAIDAHIQRFAPQNPYRPDYQYTSHPARLAHFAEIAHAIRHHGEGLETLRYVRADGRPMALLRAPEIVHLHDVARLVSVGERAGSVAAAVWLMTLLTLYRLPWSAPSAAALARGTLLSLAVLLTALWIVGPVNVFYALHTLVFPPGHAWFFYYRESLMTTLMKAPTLFGFIGAVWGLVSLGIGALLIALERRMRRAWRRDGKLGVP